MKNTDEKKIVKDFKGHMQDIISSAWYGLLSWEEAESKIVTLAFNVYYEKEDLSEHLRDSR